MTTSRLLFLAATLVAPTLTACASPDDGLDCTDGRCDVPDSEVPASPCDGIIKDRSGANHSRVAGRNNDALSKLIFQKGADGKCPTSFADMMAALRKVDTQGCSGAQDGIQTRFVSETGQSTGDASTSYRTVTTRRCGGRGTEGILFSQFATKGDTAPPANVEIIAFDETQGVFNFYDSDGRNMNFFGSSKDFVVQGQGSGQTRRCAACHPSGGLNMKELDSPWMNWEGHIDNPGTNDIISGIKDFGSKTSGIEFEGTVNSGNAKWAKAKVGVLKATGDVQKLLKPLFCTVEINLANGAAFKGAIGGGNDGDGMRSIPFKSILDPQLAGFGSLSVDQNDYDAQIKANGQVVDGIPGAIDTVIRYFFPMRSRLDDVYVQQLVSAGVIDDDFVKDVLMVDFTRPIFSDDRCGLLTFAPTLSSDDMTPAKIRDGFIAKLEAESPADGSPAAVLLANLKAQGDQAAHTATVKTFTDACQALGSQKLMNNALQITSLNRNTVRDLPIAESPSLLPRDNLSTDKNARLSPKTCEVVTSFEAP